MIVTLADARALGYCSKGLRYFCERNGLSWTRFVRDGLPEEELAVFTDPMVLKLIARAKKREQNGR